MQSIKGVQWGRQGQVWTRRLEHGVLRVMSFAFSLASAHAIRWFFSPLDSVDFFQPFITWMIALSFGVLGYFVSRGLAHRMMNRERLSAYVPICLIVEFVEIFCNSSEAISSLPRLTWLMGVPQPERTVLVGLTCLVWSCIPLVSIFLAVVDVDLMLVKLGVRSSTHVTQPKTATAPTGGGFTVQPQPAPSYPSGYNGVPVSQQGQQASPQRGWNPFGSGRPAVVPVGTAQASSGRQGP